MSHDKVVAFCEPNKCKVEVPTKEEVDPLLNAITIKSDGGISVPSVSVTNNISAGTITATNKFSGILYGKIYVDGQYTTSGGIATAASCPAQSASSTTTNDTSSTITVGKYTYPSISYPLKVSSGVYIESASYVSGSLPAQVTSRTLTFTLKVRSPIYNSTGTYFNGQLFINGTRVHITKTFGSGSFSGTLATYTCSVKPGDTVYGVCSAIESLLDDLVATVTISASPTYYIKAND